MKTWIRIGMLCTLLLFMACKTEKAKEETDYQISDADLKELVERTYQYVALYNVNTKFALSQGGWNTIKIDTTLKDHTLKDIARPNNDSFYISALLDLRAEPVVMYLPAFGSRYTSLMVTAFDHYVNVPKSTGKGDFQQPEYVLFYSDKTPGYNGEPVEGINTVLKCSGDFVSAVLRVMPHSSEPEKFKAVKAGMAETTVMPLSQFLKREPVTALPWDGPQVGKTDADTYGDNFYEVMQYVVNHIGIEASDSLDQKLVEVLKPLGIAPGQSLEALPSVRIDGDRLRSMAEKIKAENMDALSDKTLMDRRLAYMFQPKGTTNLETLLGVSVVGPIGLPMQEAVYLPVNGAGGEGLNAMNDYVIHMSKEALPPAKAFWSVTLYDKENGFFIPNDQKKYSVGANAGMKLNSEGGIDIVVAAEKPAGVPDENWLPISREDVDIDMILRIYDPDLERLKDYSPPIAEKRQ